ncbi:MAG: hypothetical protein L6420_10625 [Elusimicrobia bacterium]|nr:hypothetical protein [Elusimicrobiota bacterium]
MSTHKKSAGIVADKRINKLHELYNSTAAPTKFILKNIFLSFFLSLVCLAMCESPALAAQKVLVIRITEKNWDDLPGRTGPYPKEKIGPGGMKERKIARKKTSLPRVEKGRPATYEGYYEDEIVVERGWDNTFSAADVLKKFEAQISSNTYLVVWYHLQFRGFNRGFEASRIVSVNQLPYIIKPDRVFNYINLLRFPVEFQIRRINKDGTLTVDVHNKKLILPIQSEQILTDTQKTLSEKDVGLETGRKLGGWEPGAAYQWKESYTFRTQVVMKNLGFIE